METGPKKPENKGSWQDYMDDADIINETLHGLDIYQLIVNGDARVEEERDKDGNLVSFKIFERNQSKPFYFHDIKQTTLVKEQIQKGLLYYPEFPR